MDILERAFRIVRCHRVGLIGKDVHVHEVRQDSGARFDGDFQGIEVDQKGLFR